MPSYAVHYMKPEYFRDGTMGYDWLKKHNQLPSMEKLAETHVKVCDLIAADLEDVYFEMQGENWSPNGEKRDLIKSLGLKHTSMSVGDCVVHDGKLLMVDRFGFTVIE